MDLWAITIPPIASFAAVAAVAALGYLVGNRARKNREELRAESDRDLRSSRAVTREMEKITRSLRRSASRSRADMIRRRAGLLNLRREETTMPVSDRQTDGAWLPLETGDACLIRQDPNHLMTVADVRAAAPLARAESDPGDTLLAMPATAPEESSNVASRS
jgi:hypothetical protein